MERESERQFFGLLGRIGIGFEPKHVSETVAPGACRKVTPL